MGERRAPRPAGDTGRESFPVSGLGVISVIPGCPGPVGIHGGVPVRLQVPGLNQSQGGMYISVVPGVPQECIGPSAKKSCSTFSWLIS
jgi:hypothetical protein